MFLNDSLVFPDDIYTAINDVATAEEIVYFGIPLAATDNDYVTYWFSQVYSLCLLHFRMKNMSEDDDPCDEYGELTALIRSHAIVCDLHWNSMRVDNVMMMAVISGWNQCPLVPAIGGRLFFETRYQAAYCVLTDDVDEFHDTVCMTNALSNLFEQELHDDEWEDRMAATHAFLFACITTMDWQSMEELLDKTKAADGACLTDYNWWRVVAMAMYLTVVRDTSDKDLYLSAMRTHPDMAVQQKIDLLSIENAEEVRVGAMQMHIITHAMYPHLCCGPGQVHTHDSRNELRTRALLAFLAFEARPSQVRALLAEYSRFVTITHAFQCDLVRDVLVPAMCHYNNRETLEILWSYCGNSLDVLPLNVWRLWSHTIPTVDNLLWLFEKIGRNKMNELAAAHHPALSLPLRAVFQKQMQFFCLGRHSRVGNAGHVSLLVDDVMQLIVEAGVRD